MNFLKPIYWRQGIFLQPQHFQYSEMYRKAMFVKSFQFVRPHCQGVARLVLSEERLQAGFLTCTELEAIMPSGYWVELGKNALLGDADIRNLVTSDGVIPVAVGLPRLVAGMPAVARQGFDGRFAQVGSPESLPDLFDDTPDAEIERLWFHLRFLVGDDIASAEGMEVLMIARIVVSGGRVSLADDYAPCCLRLEASPVLAKSVRAIIETLETRAQRLAEMERPWRLEGELMNSGWLRDRMVHSEIAQAVVQLNYRIQLQSPVEWLFEPLLVLVSRLSTIGGISTPDVPSWDYDDPCRSFNKIAFVLGGLLEQLRSGPDSVAVFQPKPGWLEAMVPASARVGQHNVYLVLKDVSEAELTSAAEPKMASSSRIETIVSRALPGISLERLERIPYGITNAATAIVWKVDTQSSLWQEAMAGGGFCLHWLDLPRDAQASLVFFRI